MIGGIVKKVVWLVLLGGAVAVGVVAYQQREALGGRLHQRFGAEQKAAAAAVVLPPTQGVSALGRLEPHHGVRHVAGPSTQLMSVVERLLVDEGDRVHAGDLLATIDTEAVLDAQVAQVQAELANAQREYDRSRGLNKDRLTSDSETEAWAMRVAVADAALRKAHAELELARVHAPVSGQVLEVHARPGELIGPAGILELAEIDRMYAIAEVYETDAQRVHLGQKATVSSPALSAPISGTVEWIGLKVHKQDEQGTDPAARKDARIVEVKVRLDDSATAASYTNLQVDVVFDA